MFNINKILRNNFSTKVFRPLIFFNLERRNSVREWKEIDKNTLKLRCYDCLYVHTLGDENKPIGIDPDGGPFIKVGQTVNVNGNKYEISEIGSTKNIEVIDINFKVKPLE